MLSLIIKELMWKVFKESNLGVPAVRLVLVGLYLDLLHCLWVPLDLLEAKNNNNTGHNPKAPSSTNTKLNVHGSRLRVLLVFTLFG